MKVSLRRIQTADARFFLNTWPMYVHELTAFDTSFYTLDGQGRWQPDIAGDWIAETTPAANLRGFRADSDPGQPFQRAYDICCDGRVVGFVCVGLAPFRHMPEDADVVLAELFLVRSHRGKGVADTALGQLLAQHPGRWFLEALHDNARAIRFWRRVLPLGDVRGLEERKQQQAVSWRFTVRVNASDSPRHRRE